MSKLMDRRSVPQVNFASLGYERLHTASTHCGQTIVAEAVIRWRKIVKLSTGARTIQLRVAFAPFEQEST
jgi:hypothetical protein